MELTPLWGFPRINSAGSLLADLTDFYNLSCLNPDSIPTFFNHPIRAPSTIDLMFSSSNISPLCDVSVGCDSWGSDHFPISININLQIKSISFLSNKICLTREQVMCKPLINGICTENCWWDLGKCSFSFSRRKIQHFYSPHGNHLLSKHSRNNSKQYIPSDCSSRGLPPAPWLTPECGEVSDRISLNSNYWKLRSISGVGRESFEEAKGLENFLRKSQLSHSLYGSHAQTF